MAVIAQGAADGPYYDSGCFRGFGDPIALNPAGDPFASCLSCGDSGDVYQGAGGFESVMSAGTGSVYVARARTGTGGALRHDVRPFVGWEGSSSGADITLGSFPSPVDGRLMFSERFLRSDSDAAPRAVVPGLLHVPQNGVLQSAVQPRDFVEGSGPLAGRVIVAVANSTYVYNGRQGMSFVDITGPWR